MRSPHVPVFLTAAVVLAASVASAQPVPEAGPGSGPGIANAQQLLETLLGLFVAATVLEFALTALFQWRLYRELFNGRAVKTLVTVGVGLIVVTANDYDVFARIMAEAGGSGKQSAVTTWLSAFILAGGSAGVNHLLRSLGFRPPVETLQDRPAPSESHAWVSVRVIQRRAVGMVDIGIEKIKAPAPEDLVNPPLVGRVGGTSLLMRLRGVFFADTHRFPTYGGRTVEAGPVYRIVAAGRRRAMIAGDPDEPFVVEVFKGRFAGRAVIDLSCEI